MFEYRSKSHDVKLSSIVRYFAMFNILWGGVYEIGLILILLYIDDGCIRLGVLNISREKEEGGV